MDIQKGGGRESCGVVDFSPVQCDQIRQNFATLAKVLRSLAIFKGLFKVWQTFYLLWQKNYAFGLINIILKGKN